MTANRNRKQRIRSRQIHDGVAYNTARRRVDAPAGQQSAGVRHRRACDVLDVRPGGLPAALTEFAGLRPPTGALGDALLTRALEIVEDSHVPFGALGGDYYHSLALFVTDSGALDDEPDIEAVRCKPAPVYDPQMQIAAVALFAEIRSLSPGELRTAAQQLGVLTATTTTNIRRALFAQRRIGTAATTAEFLERAAEVLSTLRSAPPHSWAPICTDALRRAVVTHLAQIGDALLQASDNASPLPALTWQRGDGGSLHATYRSPELPIPLSVMITSEPFLEDVTSEELFGGSSQKPEVQRLYRCEVGILDGVSGFCLFASEVMPSEVAARFVGRELVAQLMEDPLSVRSLYGEGERLLVPLTADDVENSYRSRSCELWPCDLYFLMTLMSGLYTQDRGGARIWTRPGILVEVLEAQQLPESVTGSAAFTDRADSGALDRFFAEYGYVSDDLSRRYLVGLTEDPAALSLSERHYAGMKSVLGRFTATEIAADLYGGVVEDNDQLAVMIAAVKRLADIGQLDEALACFDAGVADQEAGQGGEVLVRDGAVDRADHVVATEKDLG